MEVNPDVFSHAEVESSSGLIHDVGRKTHSFSIHNEGRKKKPLMMLRSSLGFIHQDIRRESDLYERETVRRSSCSCRRDNSLPSGQVYT